MKKTDNLSAKELAEQIEALQKQLEARSQVAEWIKTMSEKSFAADHGEVAVSKNGSIYIKEFRTKAGYKFFSVDQLIDLINKLETEVIPTLKVLSQNKELPNSLMGREIARYLKEQKKVG